MGTDTPRIPPDRRQQSFHRFVRGVMLDLARGALVRSACAERSGYSLNNITSKRNADGSVTI